MTTPMESLPHKIVRCTRDTTRFLPVFLPDHEVQHILRYALGLASTEFRESLDVLAAGYDLTREALIVYDRTGCVSDFFERLHQILAMALIKKHGLRDCAWRPHQQFSRRYLETPQDVLDAMAQLRAVPVSEGRVKYAKDYPGLITDATAAPTIVTRPAYFGPSYPDAVVLELRRPPCFDELEEEEWRAMLRQRSRALERESREARRRAGTGFLGPDALASLDPLTPLREDLRPGHVPRESVQAAHAPSRGRQVARRLRTFKRDYRARWIPFSKGDHSVVFPAGTFQVARYAGARTEDAHAAARRHAYPVRGGPTPEG